MSDRDGRRGAVFGKSRSGKTAYSINLLKDADRLFVFDPKGTWVKSPGFEIIKHFAQVKTFLDDIGDRPFRAVYMPEKAARCVERLSTLSLMLMDHQDKYFWDKGGKKITLVVDELADAFPLAVPDLYSGFREMCRKGGEYGVNVLGITQRPATVHTDFRGNLDFITCFQFSLAIDRKAVALAMEDDAIESELMGLDKYHFVEFTDGAWTKRPPLSL